jgi:hypothetical protein
VKIPIALITALVTVIAHDAMAQPQAARPQASSGDVSVSYSYLSAPAEGANLPAGWLVSASRRLAGPLSVVGEVGGNYMFEDADVLQVYTYQAGVRAGWFASGQLPTYVQVLAGGATMACCGESATRFVVEPGFGLEVPVSQRAIVRAGVGFPLLLGDDGPPALVRAHVGVGFTLPPARRRQ